VSDPRTLEEKLREIADNDLYRAHAYGLHALADAVAALERENATLREQLASAKADGERALGEIMHQREVMAVFQDGVPPSQADLNELLADRERLTFLIACGPPGASQSEWLSEEAWEAATCHVEDDGTDQEAMRAAIDAARAAGGEG
jgi:hypothetical protein